MKLIVAGATGFVGKEVVRQALRNPTITSVVALARKPVQTPENAGSNPSKLKSIVLEDWTSPYPDSVKSEMKGADACIWTLAITPTKSKGMDFEYVSKVNVDYTVQGIQSMAAVANKPFRFIYTSGVTIERDQNKPLSFLVDYRRMRGRAENACLDFAKEHAPDVQVTVTRPSGIHGPGKEAPANPIDWSQFKEFIPSHPSVHVSELAAAMIDQCLNGITKDPLWGTDLVEIGQRVLREEDYLK